MKPKQPHEISWIIEQKIKASPETSTEAFSKENMTNKTSIRYLRFQPIGDRIVAFAQLFHEDGTKLFPDRVVDAPLVQILEFVNDEDYEVENSYEILSRLVCDNGFSA